MLRRFLNKRRNALTTCLEVGGIGCVVAQTWLVWPDAGPFALGAALVVVGALAA